jgi:hypothetical protein
MSRGIQSLRWNGEPRALAEKSREELVYKRRRECSDSEADTGANFVTPHILKSLSWFIVCGEPPRTQRQGWMSSALKADASGSKRRVETMKEINKDLGRDG